MADSVSVNRPGYVLLTPSACSSLARPHRRWEPCFNTDGDVGQGKIHW